MRRGRPMARSTLRTRSGGTLRHRRTAAGLIPHSTAIAFQSFFLAIYRIVASRGGRLADGVPMSAFPKIDRERTCIAIGTFAMSSSVIRSQFDAKQAEYRC